MAVLAAAASAPHAAAAPFAITIDGGFEEWAAVSVAWTDPAGDGGGSGVDFGRIWIADDARFFFLKLEVGTELSLDEQSDIQVYLDTDANPQTGAPVEGLGAELQWFAGQRQGLFWHDGRPTTVFHDDVGFVAGPTVTSSVFEVALARDALPDGVNALFNGPQIALLVRDGTGGDSAPDGGAPLAYVFDQGTSPVDVVIPLERIDPADLRLQTWNVLGDGPWGRAAASFGRLLAAGDADVMSFQEIYTHSAAQTAAFVAQWLGGTWYSAANADCKLVSRFPIVGTWPLDGNLAALVDAPPPVGELLVVNAHLPCCDNESARQSEIDHIMSFIRDAKLPGGAITLPAGTPMVITGDLNLVGLSQQLTTLLTGDIVNQITWGPAFDPDWDGSDSADLLCRQTELRMGYTWRSDSSTFWPGHLDYVIYTDSAAAVARHFVVYTPEMSPANLAAYGLLPGDSLATDHLLLEADFRPPCPGDLDASGDVGITDLLALLGSWGASGGPGDLDGDGDVDVVDFLALLGAWGPCPST